MPLMLQLSLGQLWQEQAQEQEQEQEQGQEQVFEALLAQQMPMMFFSGFVLGLEQPVAVVAVVAVVAAVVAVVAVVAAAAAAGANPRTAQQIIFSARENDARNNMFGHQTSQLTSHSFKYSGPLHHHHHNKHHHQHQQRH
jgi:multidrug efflux pump subunit AcrB